MRRMTYTVSEEELDRIDSLQTEFGFGTRSEFVREAALSFGQSHDDQRILAGLASINVYLKQIKRRQQGHLVLMKTEDVRTMMGQVEKVMSFVITPYFSK